MRLTAPERALIKKLQAGERCFHRTGGNYSMYRDGRYTGHVRRSTVDACVRKGVLVFVELVRAEYVLTTEGDKV